MDQLTVLGIPVGQEQLEQWLEFYAPARQPFAVATSPPQLETADLSDLATPRITPTDEWRDTFFLYGTGELIWLTEQEWLGLPDHARRRLAAERSRRLRPKPAPVWPSDPMVVAHLLRWIEAGVRPSLHVLARAALTRVSAGPLPRARQIAGSFPRHSGPNCFGAVMTAAGQPVEHDWVQPDQFEGWLEEHTLPDPAGCDQDPGRVLIWHEHGTLAHAAVTLGDGWVLHKPSQSWSSPTLVWTVRELVRSWRLPGTTLTRRRIR